MDAAAAWKTCKVIGLDVVDVFSDQWKSNKSSMPNVEFVRSNLCVFFFLLSLGLSDLFQS